MVTRSDDSDDDDGDYVDDCSDGDGADDRALSEELVHHANSAGGGETDGISNGMEAGAFVALASMPSPGGDRQTCQISTGGMEEGASNFVAPASIPTREQFSTGEQPESQDGSCTQGSFGESGSSPVVNGSRLGDRSAAGIEETFTSFDSDENLEIPEPSESRAGNDDSSVLDLSWIDMLIERLDNLFERTSRSDIDTDVDLDLGIAQEPTDEAMLATNHGGGLETAQLSVDPVANTDAELPPALEIAESSVDPVANTDAEPPQPPLLTEDGLTNFLRNWFLMFSNPPLFPEEDLEQVAGSMIRTLLREPISIGDRLSFFLRSLYLALDDLYRPRNYLYPDSIRSLVVWLRQRYGPPAAPVAGEKSETSVGNAGKKKASKKRGPYRCSFCGELKVKIINGIKIPHGPCPRNQNTDTGRSKETDPDENANDIDRFLKNPPEGLDVIYAHSPNDEDSSGCDRESAAVSSDGDVDDDGDKKPAAVRREGNVDDDGDKKPAAIDRPRRSRASDRPSRAPGLARPLELGTCIPVSAPKSKRKKPNNAERPVRGDDSTNVQAPIEREESHAQDLSSNNIDNEEENVEKENGNAPKPKDSDESGNE